MVSVKSLKQSWGTFSQKFLNNTETEKKNSEGSISLVPETKQETGHKNEEIEEKLKVLFENSDLLTSGKVSFINLDKIRIKLGKNWPKYEATIKQFANQVIEKRISSQDLYYQMDGDIYVFVFSNLTPEEAGLKCALIAKEIGEQVFGDDWSDEKYATSVAISQADGSIQFKSGSLEENLLANLNAAEQSNPAQLLNETHPEQIEKELQKTTQEISQLETDLDGIFGISEADTPPEEIVHKFSTLMEKLHQMDSRLLDYKEINDYKSDDPKWVAFFNESEKTTGTEQEDLSKKLAKMIGASERVYKLIQDNIFPLIEEEEAEEDLSSYTSQQKRTDIPEILLDSEPDLAFHYSPIWQPSANIINTYRASAAILIENSAWDISEVSDSLDENVIGLFDRLTLRRALVEMHEAVQNGKICAMVIPVHFSTLNNKNTRTEFLEICKTIPETYRRLVAWEIIKSNTTTWLSQLSTAISAIKPFGRMVCLEIDISMPDFRDLKAMGVDAVGFNANTIANGDQNFLAKLGGFCTRAEMHGLKTFLEEIPTSNLTLHAAAAGFSFLTGAAVAKPEKQLGGIYEMTFAKIYDENYKKNWL